ncbi:MAG: hypothetical protein E6Q97_16765 [Desulfurellales bacterium]|nr:MAG: hypothetical protein E6Q97_16765 [Desulfurellales bacterium]
MTFNCRFIRRSRCVSLSGGFAVSVGEPRRLRGWLSVLPFGLPILSSHLKTKAAAFELAAFLCLYHFSRNTQHIADREFLFYNCPFNLYFLGKQKGQNSLYAPLLYDIAKPKNDGALGSQRGIKTFPS